MGAKSAQPKRKQKIKYKECKNMPHNYIEPSIRGSHS